MKRFWLTLGLVLLAACGGTPTPTPKAPADTTVAVPIEKAVVGVTTAPPVARFIYSCNTLRVCRFDGSSSTVPAGALAYSWYFGDGTAAGALIVPSKTFKVAGTYTVRFVVMDSAHRVAADTQAVAVGVAAPAPPPVVATTTPPSVTGQHRSWLVGSYTDFYFSNYRPIDTATLRIVASRMDRLVNGDTALWRAANRSIEQTQYSLYWFALTTTADTLGSSGIGPLDAFLVAHHYPIESAFLHVRGSTPSKATRIGWIAQDKDSAVAVNPADAGWRAYALHRVTTLLQEGYAGAFYDVFGRGMFGKVLSSAEGDSTWYTAALTSELRTEKATGAVLLLNTAAYNTAFDSLCIAAAGGVHMELTNNPLGNNLATQLNYWRWIDHLVAAGARRVEFVSNYSWYDVLPSTATAGNDVTPMGRQKQAEYVSYLMVKDSGSVVSFAPDNYWRGKPSTMTAADWLTSIINPRNHWLASWNEDIGQPTGPRVVLLTGKDPVGQTYQVWKRTFTHGVVLMRTQGVRPTNYGDTTAVAVALGTQGRLLRSDGTTVAVSTVRLRASEGVEILEP